MVWSCPPFIKSGQNHLARLSEMRKKTRQTEEEVGRKKNGEWRGLRFAKSQRAVQNREKKEETGFEIISGAPTIFAVKG